MNIQIEVENIKCGGCMNSIKTALLKNQEVEQVEIDKETEMVAIQAKASAERSTFVNLLSKLGYPEKGQNDFMHKAKSYVSYAVGQINK